LAGFAATVIDRSLLNEACRQAPDGKVLDVAETLAMKQGRELTRVTLEASVNQERDEIEKKVP